MQTFGHFFPRSGEADTDFDNENLDEYAESNSADEKESADNTPKKVARSPQLMLGLLAEHDRIKRAIKDKNTR